MAIPFRPGNVVQYNNPSAPAGMSANPNAGDESSAGFGQYTGAYLPYTTGGTTPVRAVQRSTPLRTTPRSSGRTSGGTVGNVQTWLPAGGAQAPTLGPAASYMMPEYDQDRVSQLANERMAVPLGRLRKGLSSALLESRYSTNPNVRANARRQALAGYGEGLSSIRAGATREAQSIYQPEYAAQVTRSSAEFSQANQRANIQFQADMNDYIRRGQRISAPADSAALNRKPSVSEITDQQWNKHFGG